MRRNWSLRNQNLGESVIIIDIQTHAVHRIVNVIRNYEENLLLTFSQEIILFKKFIIFAFRIGIIKLASHIVFEAFRKNKLHTAKIIALPIFEPHEELGVRLLIGHLQIFNAAVIAKINQMILNRDTLFRHRHIPVEP